MRELDVGKKYKTYEWWVGGKQYVTDIKGTKGIITRPYDVSAHGKLFTVTDDVYVLHPSLDPTKEFFEVVPKGTTFSYGTGVVRDPITGQLVKRSTTKVFKTIGVGREIPVPGLIDPEGVVPHLFKAKGYVKTTLPTQVTPSRGIGIFQTGREGEVILTEFARKQYVTGKWSTINKIRNVGLFDKSITTKELLRLTPDEYAYATWQTSKAPKSLGVPSDIGQVDFTKTISLKYKATGGEYLFVGEYPAKGFDVGKIKLTGRISVITGKPTEKVITKAIEKEQLLWTDQAVGTLVRPATTGEKVIVESILPSIAEEVGAVASLAPPTIVYAPSAKAVVEKVGVSPLLIFTGRPKTITEREKPAFITGLKTEQELRQEMISIVGMKTKTLLDQRQKQDLIAKPMVTTITGTTEIEKQEEIDIVTPIQDVGLDLGQQQRQEQLLKLAQKQKSMLKLDTLTVTTQVTTTTPPSIVTVPKIPWLVLPEDEKAAKPLLKEKEPVGKGFNVYVKERSMYGRKIVKPTKFKKVNVHSLTKRDALSLGATIADESAAISFKIKPTDKKPKKSLLPTKSFESIGHKFRKKGDVYIEKTKYRIDTPGEIKEISARGWLSNKRKAMTKKDLVGGKVDRLIGTKNSTKRKKNVRYI